MDSIPNIIKAILAILFIICLADMPYNYYELVRTIGMIGFIYLGIESHKTDEELWKYIYWGSAVLINPIVKISLGRSLWNTIDVILAILLLLHIHILYSKKTNI